MEQVNNKDKTLRIELQTIGIIYTPYKNLKGMPIQPTVGKGIKGSVEVYEKFYEGIKDLEGFSHIILVYYFHKSKTFELIVTPFLDKIPRGVFSTRAPKRPNPIGLSIVKLNSIEENILHVEDIDILNGTPLLDIKPYVPNFDNRSNPVIGWIEKVKDNIENKRSDERFIEEAKNNH